MQEFPFHSFRCGQTRSGKTYGAIQDMKASDRPVLFFNMQEEDTPFIKASRVNTFPQLRDALRQGKKIDYIPSERKSTARLEIEKISEWLFYEQPAPAVSFYIDEVHELAPEGMPDSMLFTIATRGLRKGIYCDFLCQRPALVSKTIYTQAYKHFIFSTTGERGYFEAKGIPYNDVQERIRQGGLHSYCVFEGGVLTGPFKY